MSSTDLIEPEKISPEGLTIAQVYLTEGGGNMMRTAEILEMPVDELELILKKSEVTEFINRVYYESGFRNRNKIAAVMDEIIAAKLEEMDETGITTDKDIVDLLQIVSNNRIKEMELELKLLEAKRKRSEVPSVQNNIQINGGYDTLLSKLGG